MTGKRITLPLGELLEFTIGGVWGEEPGTLELNLPVYRQTEFNDDGRLEMPADAVRSVSESQIKRRTLQSGDILLQKAAGTATLPGRVVAVKSSIESPATFSNFLQLLRPRTDICTPEFVFLVFWNMHKVGKAFEFQRGTNIKNLDLPNYLMQQIELPDIHTQQRIVDLISTLDSYIGSLEVQLDLSKKSRNAVLHELLTTDGVDWKASTIGELLTLEYGKPLTEENRDGVGFPVYASAGVVGFHSEPLVSEAPVIVVGRKGTAGSVNWSDTPCYVIDTAYYVLTTSDIDMRFLFLLLNFVDLKSVTAQTGVPGLNRDRAYSLKCNVPPKSTQLEIVETISCMEEMTKALELTLVTAKKLRSGLLASLVSGDHEIPSSYDKVIGGL